MSTWQIIGLNEKTETALLLVDPDSQRITIREADTESTISLTTPIKSTQRGLFLVLKVGDRVFAFQDAEAGKARQAVRGYNAGLPKATPSILNRSTLPDTSITHPADEDDRKHSRGVSRIQEPYVPSGELSHTLRRLDNWLSENSRIGPAKRMASSKTLSGTKHRDHRLRTLKWAGVLEFFAWLVMLVGVVSAIIYIRFAVVYPAYIEDKAFNIGVGASIGIFSVLHGAVLLTVSSYVMAKVTDD